MSQSYVKILNFSASHRSSCNAIYARVFKCTSPSIVLSSASLDNQFDHRHHEALDAHLVRWARVYARHEGDRLRTYQGWLGLKTETWSAEGKGG